MGFPTVTNTFVNGATADATQVNQNFTDILNGLSDTTKDFSMNNGTLASTLTCNGNVVLGSSSSKTVNWLGSLISSVPVSANASWDLGSSTLGFKSIYIGSTGSFTTRIIAGATASWTLTLPTTAGSNLQILTTDGTGVSSWQNNYTDPTARQNYGISSSVGSSALTINLLGSNGSTPSASNPVNINFRNSTSATGTPTFVQCTGALSITVPSTATLGTTNGVTSYVYLWAVNNAGTIELAVSGNFIQGIDEGTLQTTTVIAGASNISGILYATVGRSNVAVRLLGRLAVNEATAGTWASNSSEISPANFLPQLGLFNYYTGFHSNANSWSTTSATFTDPTNSGGATLTKRQSSGMVVVTAASTNPGIQFTPSSITAAYLVIASFGATGSSNVEDYSFSLTDGTQIVSQQSGQQGTALNKADCMTMGGLYIPGVTSTVNLRLQIAAPNGGTSTLVALGTLTPSIEWSIIQIR